MTINQLLAGAALVMTGLTSPIAAQADTGLFSVSAGVIVSGDLVTPAWGTDEVERRGRGGRRPRVPGGSGCDDAGDIAEHPECRA